MSMAQPVAEFEETTIVVELTPAGRGAVAVVLVDGPQALSAVEPFFIGNSKRPLRSGPLQRIGVGRWGNATGEELVIARRSERQIEVHCHGGVAAVRRIVADLAAAGCEEISWRDWLAGRCSHSGCRPKLPIDDVITRAAQLALADAITLRTAAVLLDQFNGALSTAIDTAIGSISRGEWDEAGQLIDSLLSHRDFGLHLTQPWHVVLAGPPNVGKSSLINALAGFQRAIVSPMPGTTRDVVTLTTAVDGWPVELADTAGLRDTTDAIESAGVRLAEEMLAAADVVLLVHDASQSESLVSKSGYLAMCSSLAGHRRVIDVWNKIDLRPPPNAQCAWPIQNEHDAVRANVRTSAITGAGIDELIREIDRALVPNVPPSNAPVPFSARQFESLAVARNAIKRQHAAPAQEALQSLLAFS